MFNLNKITAEQPSVDPYIGFTIEMLWTSFRLVGNFSIDSMLTKDNRCCPMCILLLNNHIKKLLNVIYKIINTTECSTHVLNKVQQNIRYNIRHNVR